MDTHVGWTGFAIVCEQTHASRASQYIQDKYKHKAKFTTLLPSKDGVLVFLDPSENFPLTSNPPNWIEELLLDLYTDPLVLR